MLLWLLWSIQVLYSQTSLERLACVWGTGVAANHFFPSDTSPLEWKHCSCFRLTDVTHGELSTPVGTKRLSVCSAGLRFSGTRSPPFGRKASQQPFVKLQDKYIGTPAGCRGGASARVEKWANRRAKEKMQMVESVGKLFSEDPAFLTP